MSGTAAQPVCFKINAADNVATLLDDAREGEEIEVRGESAPGTLRTLQAIKSGHKIALFLIAQGAPIVKYGFPIGEATHPISAGEWVHLHNCRSLHDAASSALDLESGARKETPYG